MYAVSVLGFCCSGIVSQRALIFSFLSPTSAAQSKPPPVAARYFVNWFHYSYCPMCPCLSFSCQIHQYQAHALNFSHVRKGIAVWGFLAKIQPVVFPSLDAADERKKEISSGENQSIACSC